MSDLQTRDPNQAKRTAFRVLGGVTVLQARRGTDPGARFRAGCGTPVA